MKAVKFIIVALLLTNIAAKAQNTSAAGINNVIKGYIGVKDALVADNSKLANERAKTFTAAIKEVKADQLDAAQKKTWAAYAEKLRFDGDHISETDKLAHQREHFTSLSKNMLAVVKAFKNNGMVLYEQYCPMKKASWLSDEASIRNPYYGKAMEDCGTVKQTFKKSEGK